MIVLYWCPTCARLYSTAEIHQTGAAIHCGVCSGNVEVRWIPDDPDDEAYGRPRCPTCKAELKSAARFCPRCGIGISV